MSKARYNDEGKKVPDVCPKCGSKIGVYFKGEPVYLCSNEKCKKYFGTLPFKESKKKSKVTTETALTSKERNELDDSIFGIPELRKYPLNDKEHVLLAIRFFNRAEVKYEKELAKRIFKAMKKYDIPKSVIGDKNRLKRYI